MGVRAQTALAGRGGGARRGVRRAEAFRELSGLCAPPKTFAAGMEACEVGRQITTLSVMMMTLCGSGCASSSRMKGPWTPTPKVDWSDLAAQPVGGVQNGFLILEESPSSGRFPCSMSVSRMAAEIPGEAGGATRASDAAGAPALAVPATPHNEFLTWNTSFDNLPAISETFPVIERDLGEYAPEPGLLLSAANAFGAGLSLVYAVNAIAPTRYEILGVLHDTRTGLPIAVVHTVNESIERPQKHERAPNNTDAWEYEGRALARAQFKRLTVECIRDLIARDTPEKTAVPEGWTPDRPLAPAHWPPRPFQP